MKELEKLAKKLKTQIRSWDDSIVYNGFQMHSMMRGSSIEVRDLTKDIGGASKIVFNGTADEVMGFLNKEKLKIKDRAKALIKELGLTRSYIINRSIGPDSDKPYGEILGILRDNGIPKTSGAELADEIMKILKIKNEKVSAATEKVFAYKGKVITASSKKEAIHKIVADLARYTIKDTCVFEYQGKKGVATFTGVHTNFEQDVLTNGNVEVEWNGKKAKLYFNCDNYGDADSYSIFEGDETCKNICKTVLLLKNKKAKKDRFKGEFINELKDAFEYRNWKHGNKNGI